MSEKLTHDAFKPLLNQSFRVHISADQIVDVTLIETTDLPPVPLRDQKTRTREPFSLVFRGAKTFRLPQRIYSVEHSALGVSNIFLVPIGPDAQGERYEAIFN